MHLLAEFGKSDAAPIVLKHFRGAESDAAKLACLSTLGKWGSDEITDELLAEYDSASPAIRSSIVDSLLARSDSALKLLECVDAGTIDPLQIPIDQVRRAAIHEVPEIDALVRKHWGNLGPGSSEEKLATMRRFNNDLRASPGDPMEGKSLFAKHCGNCHQLHGSGNKIGPDLTTANRSDRAALLANIVDPSAVVRREYISYIVQTTSGRVLTGLLEEQDAASVTILDAQNNRTKLTRSEIEELVASDTSLMPEKILEELSPQQLRDLIGYLEQ